MRKAAPRPVKMSARMSTVNEAVVKESQPWRESVVERTSHEDLVGRPRVSAQGSVKTENAMAKRIAWRAKRKRYSREVAFMLVGVLCDGAIVVRGGGDELVDLCGLGFVLVDDAGLHDEGDVLEDIDVGEGVAGDGDDVGPFAGIE